MSVIKTHSARPPPVEVLNSCGGGRSVAPANTKTGCGGGAPLLNTRGGILISPWAWVTGVS